MTRRLLELLTLGLLITQVAFTHRLWTGGHDYPRIPFFSLLCSVPSVAEPLLLLGLLLAVLLILPEVLRPASLPDQRRERGNRLGWGLLAAGFVGHMLLNQHCLQVWAWQGLLYAIAFAGFRGNGAIVWLRRLTIAIYFYSAVSKIDLAFLQTYGQTLFDGLFAALNLPAVRDPTTKFWLIALFPVGELLVAALLAWPRMCRVGLGLSLGMHLGLLLTLGPWGLNHHAPVLIWNLFFLLQNPLLFWKPVSVDEVPSTDSETAESTRTGTRIATWLLCGALLFPVSEWFDHGDLWPSWGLYSARGARVRLYLPDDVELPPELLPFLAARSTQTPWRHLDLHRWSFAELNVPAYPEDRFQLAVARAVLTRLPPDQPFVIQHLSTADRWTAARRETFLQTHAQLDQFQRRYWLNLNPRFSAKEKTPSP